ncbi:metallophosphoesterase family protein [Calderihabitans maritimus]|uniref:Phosphoesterase n=1 Tax=Calderihabitans maritimus TaxID=1246530 RepID=A0A1Z5HVD6_9FIRM|nr:metallophosphoesterase family protein [Calderihabitans maritimus]GAW93358.1 phosphodiesterase, MJ0936 family [Calderihabitans maritimus]
MRLAVFADVHANIYALQSVLKDIEKRHVDKIICAGDLVGYAPFPNEVIELIQSMDIPTVMGNYDDGVGFHRIQCGCDYKDEHARMLGEKSILWTKKNTTEANKEFLRSLPKEIWFKAGGYRCLVVHGSPRRLNEYLYEDTPEDYLKALLEEFNVDVLICGHTHKPYHRRIQGRHVINVGSVGRPKHGDPQAVYALVEITGEVKVIFYKVDYDYDKTAKAIEESELPDELAEVIRWGRE